WLASSMVMPADGEAIRAATSFDASRLGWLNRSLTISAQRAALVPGLALSSARADIKRAGKETVNFIITGNTDSKQRFSMFAATESAGPLLKLSGKLDATVALADLLQTGDGKEAITGDIGLQLNFAGEGRSPGGLVSQLAGTGRVVPASLTLPRFNLPSVTRRLAAIDDVNTIDETINAALSQGATVVNAEPADVILQNGNLRTGTMPISTNYANGTMRLSVDFSGHKARADISLKQNTSNDKVPGVAMRLSGHPLSLNRTYDTSALKSWVVVSVLQKGMDRLEELQREEQRLLEEERQFREQQAEREAERKRRLEEASEAAARQAREEEERVNAQEGTDSPALTTEQQRLQDLIEDNIQLEIPDAAIIKPQNSGLLSLEPGQPANPN
ncbi:MAG: hypothetical protein ACR2OL_08810, partial [Anderseniella sp.]